MNDYQENMAGTPERTASERDIESIREEGGFFVEAVRVTRMPMMVTDARLDGNPIVFANAAFTKLSGYTVEELVGQDPHFMNGEKTDPEAIRQYKAAIAQDRDQTLEIVQYRKDGSPFWAMLFASPLGDGQGTVTHHFLSYLDVTRRHDAETDLRALTASLEARVAERTRELEAANERLTKLAAEREMLMVEVNHRAKNSLAIAASLVALQGRRQPDKDVRALFDATQDRLNAMARVHDLLSKSEHAQRVDLATYVRDLCESLKLVTDDDDRIRLETHAEEGLLVEADTAVPLGIVITELVLNAVKYAFPAPASGTIVTHAQRKGPGMAEIVVQDDGAGMESVREGSLGFGLVKSLVQQIDGRMDIQNDGGVRVAISFPAPA
ncbi:histidine kinase dimerization/phosphoacceptor domain -containing protein [Lichenifustis flavocetrariae]|uniref:Blue-light-activated histidine kinase n=1 Tax=Lichenifustis flavocetrariae TaxID=2949735 RepID=A0AA42CKU7_9HYPH|nr:histidine kinase dimerization/phosphoacceptor domain -containing protein [Lichenifustis flavocetrariae]MCW6509661.1 PAS domain-containing protein [Lichenifustis flavocetrariae]